MNANKINLGGGTAIQARVFCPHCWHEFPPDQTLWIAEHPDLIGDPRLGADYPCRFLPSRFNLQGAAIDARGFACHGLACPKCHLSLPRPLLEMPPVFLSILGAPACGKSYFLAAMSWQLRKVLPKRFLLSFNDADSVLNRTLHEYESLQFLNPNQNELVQLQPTQTTGDMYDTVLFGDQRVSYPRPFVFSVSPLVGHPNHGNAAAARVLCLYDNAGESFLPGVDNATNPVTRHLALSRALMFLFDPTQDMRFRKLCKGKTADPQMMERAERLERERPVRQETILAEAAQRVRRFSGLGENQKHPRPLIVVVTKLDAWATLLNVKEFRVPWESNSQGSIAAMQLDIVDTLSARLRSLLWSVSPEFVATAESFANQVVYVPISATGRRPEVDPKTGASGFRPRDIRPVWVEVPLLYTISRWMQGLIPYRKAAAGDEKRNTNRAQSPWSDHHAVSVRPSQQ
jgi:hypothetical protein